MAAAKPDMSALAGQIASTGGKRSSICAASDKADFSKANALTQAAIKGLGSPVYASMTDNRPVDSALLKAQMDVAIQKGGVKSVSKAPADRALAEAFTMKAITTGSHKLSLKATETKSSAMTPEQLAQLQKDAQAEKDAAVAARTFGGGDAKAGMGSILKEIEGQGVIAVPADKAPKGNVTLNHTKTLMEINALKGQPIFASGTDHKVEDKALAQAKTFMAIQKKGETSANVGKLGGENKAADHAKTMISLNSDKKKASLKAVSKPSEGLSAEQLKALQAAAEQEKKA